MNQSILTEILCVISVFISLLLALFLFTVKTQHKLSNRLLACFIIMSGIDISGFISYYFLNDYPDIGMFRLQTVFLIIPFFYLYVLSVCYSDFKLKPKHLLHVIPFVITNLVVTPRFYLADLPDKELFISHYIQLPEAIFIQVSATLQITFYLIAAFVVLKKSKKIYLENYTEPTIITYAWLFQLTSLLSVEYFIAFIKNLLKFTGYTNINDNAHLIVGFAVFGVLCWFVLKALHYPDLFRGVDSKLRLVQDILPEPKYGTNQPDTDQRNTGQPQADKLTVKIAQLKEFMAQTEPYLEPSLTVQDLADQMKMPVRDLSILINHHLDQHFFDFINEYRIQKAMEILKDPLKRELNIQEVLYAAGFNSKSTFNFAFKKHTQLTPTQYRNNSLQAT